MNKEQDGVLEFHKKFGAFVRSKPDVPDDSILLLRSRLIMEEAAEFVTAASKRNIVGMADALADLLYVVYGSGVSLGIDLEPVFAEVQRSNMTKEKSHDQGGKVLKGTSYSPPDILNELIKQGYNSDGKNKLG